MSAPYPYPCPNSQLIASHSLAKHFEGGYFAQTVSLESSLPPTISRYTESGAPPTPLTASNTPRHDPPLGSAALGGKTQSAWGPGAAILGGPGDGQPGKVGEVDATVIYYLLTPESSRGRMHMNLHSHFHLLHSGRALYTLIQPPTSSSDPPTIYRIVLGADPTKGEVAQLFVPGGWWKASEIPEEDLLLLDAPRTISDNDHLEERVGCLISEIVVPGWNPDQHIFIDEDKLRAMWSGKQGWEPYKKYLSSA